MVRHGFTPTNGPNVLFLAAIITAVGAGFRWLVGLTVRPQAREDAEDYDDGP